MAKLPQNEPIPWAEESDEEYVVLPPDAEVLANEKQRRKDQITEWEQKARDEPDWVGPPKSLDLRFQFSIKDLLTLTTIAAFAAMGAKLMGAFSGLLLFLLASLVWIHFRILWSEKKASRQRDIQRGITTTIPEEELKLFLREFFSYQVMDLLIGTTVVAVIFTFFKLFSASVVAILLGCTVVGGGVMYWLGVRPTMRWWRMWIIMCCSYVAFAIYAVATK